METGGLAFAVASFRLSVAAILVCSAISKLKAFGDFRHALGAYRLVPRSVLPVVAPAVPCVELTIGSLLATRIERTAAALSAGVLFAAFSAAIIINLLRRRRIACGCGRDATRAITWWHALADLLLGSCCLLAGTRGASRGETGWTPQLSATLALTTVCVMFLLVRLAKETLR